MKILSFPVLRPLLIAIICFGIMLLIHRIDRESHEPKKIAVKFEKIFGERQKIAGKILKKEIDPVEKGFTVFMFKNDSLFFWSDNSILLPAGFGYDRIAEHPEVIKLQNGWYTVQSRRSGNYSMFVFMLIKQEFPFQNEYLKNSFPGYFGIPPEVEISIGKGDIPVFFPDGRYALSLNFPLKINSAGIPATLLLFFFLLGSVFLIVFLHRAYDRMLPGFKWKYFQIAGIALDICILRGLQFYFKVPFFMYQTDLFGPSLYSSSVLLPSLGDLLIDVTLLLALSTVYFLNVKGSPAAAKTPKLKTWIAFFLTVFLFLAGLTGVLFLINDLIVNSAIPLNLQNISSLIPYSAYGIFIIWAIWASFFLFFWKPAAGVLQGLIPRIKPTLNFRIMILSIILFSALSMILINNSNNNKEKEKRKILALKLATKRNPITETLFSLLEKQILSDTVFISKAEINGKKSDSFSDKQLEAYLKKAYFNDYWNKFNIQITPCNGNKNLQIQPQGYLINCDDYFHTIIREFGETTPTKGMYFLDYGYGKENYLAKIQLPEAKAEGKKPTLTLYIELNSKYVFKDLGYPELLVDRKIIDIPDISEYSFAFYQDGLILYSAGKFQYAHALRQYVDYFKVSPFNTFLGSNHYYSRLSESGVLLISRKQQNFLTTLSPFAYLFILFGLFSFMLYMMIRPASLRMISLKTLSDRLQMAMIGMLFLSFFTLGAVMVVYIVRLNNEKNNDYLKERAFSIQMELQYKFGATDKGFLDNTTALENQLVKMSNIFFSDINIYDLAGQLIASSRPQVFKEGLISDLMDSKAFNQLKTGNPSLYIHEENIGKHNYSSAYMPFYNNNNTLLGYINLPYFTRQDDLKKEISTFLVAFINIYVLLFIMGVFIAFIIAKYIASPLRLLAVKMGGFKLGRPNERIEWKGRDEIGKLVEQYNKMVDELGESAEKLALSEREGAWREMAKQVAHEIKNPLTPMKLSVQHLLKAWNDKAPGWDQRLDRFSQTITEQIDALALIASEFSDFAKMPVPRNEKLDLAEVIQSAVFLYKDFTRVFEGSQIKGRQVYIWADHKQLLRVFTNLFNNAIEAIGNNIQGKIILSLQEENNFYLVKIQDNGHGVPNGQLEKIFQPNFTTKTGGMGLGLAIVKTILQGMNGSIQVESEEGDGTTFILKIPAYRENGPPNLP